jgi:hypothetical protein
MRPAKYDIDAGTVIGANCINVWCEGGQFSCLESFGYVIDKARYRVRTASAFTSVSGYIYQDSFGGLRCKFLAELTCCLDRDAS